MDDCVFRELLFRFDADIIANQYHIFTRSVCSQYGHPEPCEQSN